MGNLPECRLKPSPPFTYMGVDAFGPCNIITRKTRGGSVNSKRPETVYSCKRNSYRIPSYRGKNFVVSTDALQVATIDVESPRVRGILT